MNSVHEKFISVGDVTIALQPIFDFEKDGEVGFFESTLRITRTPDPIFHVRLLAIAEDLGFIHQIDTHVLSITVDVLRRNPGMTASINISQRSILDDGQHFIRRLAASNVCERLIVEITESTQIPVSWVAAFAAGVREIGCKVAIDDFETGYADEVLVQAVKPDLIKVVIDDTTLRYRERVRRTLDLAAALGAHVVGEKIDSDEKIDLMRTMGVRYLQGFALGMPILNQDLPSFLGRTMDSTVPLNNGGASPIRLDVASGFQTLSSNRKIRLVQEA